MTKSEPAPVSSRVLRLTFKAGVGVSSFGREDSLPADGMLNAIPFNGSL
jgi:hypothetical protein